MVVCLDNIYVRRINEISKLRCRTVIIGYRWFGVSLLFFFCTMKTLIIGYGLNNIIIQINLVINCKTFVCLMQQPLLQLLLHFFGFESFIITRINDFFIY